MAKSLKVTLLAYLTACFLTCCILTVPAISGGFVKKEVPLNQYGIRSRNPFVARRFVHNGKIIEMVVVPSSPYPPKGVASQVAAVPRANPAAGTNAIQNVPAMTWCFGCSATSAGSSCNQQEEQ